jgi:vacuolar protein sorting-associated protein 16
VRGLGWSEDEKLIVVTEDGTARCYFDLQTDFVPFTLGHVSRYYFLIPQNSATNLS